MSSSVKTSFKPALIVSAIYAFLAIPVPSAMGKGAYVFWTTLGGIAAYLAHNMLRWIFR